MAQQNGQVPSGRSVAEVNGHPYELQWTDGLLHINGDPVPSDAFWVAPGIVSLLLDGRSVTAQVTDEGGGMVRVMINNEAYRVRVSGEADLLLQRFGVKSAVDAAHLDVRAPMPGLVVRVLVSEGDHVAPGDGLVILEAMKMENELRAIGEGTVRAIRVSAGDAVTKNQILLSFDP